MFYFNKKNGSADGGIANSGSVENENKGYKDNIEQQQWKSSLQVRDLNWIQDHWNIFKLKYI